MRLRSLNFLYYDENQQHNDVLRVHYPGSSFSCLCICAWAFAYHRYVKILARMLEARGFMNECTHPPHIDILISEPGSASADSSYARRRVDTEMSA